MLGDLIGEETGKITGFRVLDAAGPKAEISIRTQGKISGIDYQGRTTYASTIQPGGFIFGEGQGVYMAADGMASRAIGREVGWTTETAGRTQRRRKPTSRR